MSLKDEIKAALNPPHNPFLIISQFEAWSKNQRNALLAEADSWLMQLYELDQHFFASFLMTNVPQDNPRLIAEIIKRAEANNQPNLFNAYYAQMPHDFINEEIQQWIGKKLKPEMIASRIRWRFAHPKKLLLTEASCIALYEYAPQILEVELINDIFRYQHNVKFEEGKGYETFRALVKKNLVKEKSTSLPLHQALISRFASPSEKREEVKRIIESASSWLKAEQQLNSLGISLTDEEIEMVQKRFTQEDSIGRKSWFNFLINHSDHFARQFIETEIAAAKTEAQMETIVTELRQKSWNRFYKLADSWILPVYELAPAFCLTLVAGYNGQNLKMSKQTAATLLKKVQQRNHREMLRFVYSHLYNSQEWNKAIQDVIESGMPAHAKATALEDLDCQPAYVYYGQSRAYLNDNLAAAIYELSPNYLHSFIMHNLEPRKTYPALLKAAERKEDYYRIFRETADGAMWKAAMQDLLKRDIPADAIESELERYQLNRSSMNGNMADKTQMDARILKGFIDKYGEAVLPYFERYLRWATEPRIKSLLALDIDRAELLRELNVLARREPQAFSAISAVWALPLYERGASFFESFLVRYIGRQNEYITRELLARARVDKQRNLFRSLYRLVATGQEWNKEFNQFLDSNPDDKALEEFVEMYDIVSWDYVLLDSIAAKLFQRNPDKYSPFILRHLSQQSRWGNRPNYDKLLKLAESYPQYHLDFLKNLAYEKYWQKQIQALLDSRMSGEEALQRLEELHPRNTWEVQDTSLLHKVFDKYGSDVVSYIVEHIHWVKMSDALMEKIEKVAPPSLFWAAVLKTMLSHGSSGWSHKRWNRAIEALCQQDLSDEEVKLSLQMLSPVIENRWQRYSIPEVLALRLYKKYPDASRGFLQRYYQPTHSILLFDEALHQTEKAMLDAAGESSDEEMLDYLSFCAMEMVNRLIPSAFPENPQYARPNKSAETEIETISAKIIKRFESLYQRDPQLYVRHVALMLAWWRPFAIWNPKGMETHNPIYRYIVSQHINDWMEQPEAIREVLESPNVFVQLIGLHLLRNAEHEQLAQRILENRRIFRQILLGRSRRSSKRLAMSCIEQAIAQNSDFAPALLPVLEEVADFYGKLAMSEEMMISITRIRYALEQNLPLLQS